MIYLELLFSFFKIGLFSFGGGYAMIPLVQSEIQKYGWLTPSQFADVIAIAEMTPGPIAVNTATFVGFRTAGIAGGIIATTGVALPSLMLILIVSRFFFLYREHPINTMIFYGMRPVVTGLIITAALFIAETALFKTGYSMTFLKGLFTNPLNVVNVKGVVIMLITLLAIIRFKLHPIAAIGSSGILGIVLFFVF